jgi:hypothetical protein
VADPSANERQILKAAFGRTDQCLTLEALAALSENRASERAPEHLRVCTRCQNELALLREFQQAEPRPGEVASLAWIESELQRRSSEISANAPVRVPSFWGIVNSWLPARRLRIVSLCAASLLLVVTAGLYVTSGLRPNRAAEPLVYRSQQFSIISPTGNIPEPPRELQWQAVQGSAKYQVRLMEVDRTEIWSAETSSASISIPPAVRQQMKPSRRFYWEVLALNNAGEKIADTYLQDFHISSTTR